MGEVKNKTIALIRVNRDGFWIDNLESLQFERAFPARSGAWVGEMIYEKVGDEWTPIGVLITHGSALTLPTKYWESLPRFITSGEGIVGVRDLQTIKKMNWDASKRRPWIANVRKGVGKKGFSEFDNFFAFRAPENIYIHPSMMKNRNGDVVAFKLMFGEGVEYP